MLCTHTHIRHTLAHAHKKTYMYHWKLIVYRSGSRSCSRSLSRSLSQTLIIDLLIKGAEDINICYLILALKLNMRYFGRVSPEAKGAWEPMKLSKSFIKVYMMLITHL